MPYVNNDGIKICYEVEGEGPPLVLRHGLMLTCDSWRKSGYVNALKDDYQLILIDARGHGKSDKPHSVKAYRLALMVADTVTVLDDLHIHKAHYWGYSLGGWVGWGVAKYAPDRFRSLIIGGYPPLYKKNPAGSEAMPDLLKQGWDAMLKAFESMLGQAWTPETEQRIRANDLDALIALKSSDDFRGIPGFEDVLASLKIPCLLYTGENDKGYSFTPEDVKMLPDAVFVIVPGLDHYQAFMRSDLVVPHIKKFLKNVEQTNKQ